MLVTLEGPQPSRVAVEMDLVARELPLGHAAYLLDGTGTISFDDRLRVPVFRVRTVHSAQRLH